MHVPTVKPQLSNRQTVKLSNCQTVKPKGLSMTIREQIVEANKAYRLGRPVMTDQAFDDL